MKNIKPKTARKIIKNLNTSVSDNKVDKKSESPISILPNERKISLMNDSVLKMPTESNRTVTIGNFPRIQVDYPVIKSENSKTKFYTNTSFQKKLVEVFDFVLRNGYDYYYTFTKKEFSQQQEILLEHIYRSQPLETAINTVHLHEEFSDLTTDQKEYWMALRYVASVLPHRSFPA
ncbi:hypothetical protein RF11_05149 [Thelohanellus kitauei]|uniref:Uncharacterized protein n=1 Tax=Thelohanellus kitauei TaxID=669202 RepID=A0A0C2JDU4_THEKT|nr:hypothetical protein RF11_05149 [Thelohanellus kitauei]